VIVERTVGEVSARCHDEQANSLALNLMHDIVTGEKNVEEAREYYAKEFLDARRKKPTPYMEELQFEPGTGTADPDERLLSDEQLEKAVDEGKRAEARPLAPERLEERSTRRRRPSRRRLVDFSLLYPLPFCSLSCFASARSASSRLRAPKRTPCEVATRKFFTP